MVCLLNKSRCRGVIFTWMLLSMFFEIIALYYNGIDGLGFIMWNGVRGGLTPDLFESIWHAANPEPYQEEAIYPPLIYVMLKFFLLFISNPFPLEDRWVEMMSLTYSTDGLKVFIVYSIMVFSSFMILIYKFFEGRSYEKIIIFLYFISSAPFLYMYERGNTVFISMVCVWVFFFWYDANIQYKRRLAIICLSVATCIKIYPILAFFILLCEKKIALSLKYVFFVLLLFFVPFYFTGGMDSFIDMLYNIDSLSNETVVDKRDFGYGFKVNIENLVLAMAYFGNIDIDMPTKYINVLLGVILLFVLILLPKKEDKILSIILMMILLPPFSWLYNVVYLFIAIVVYFNKDEYNIIDFVFFILFFLAVIPLPYGYAMIENPGNPITWSTVVSNFSLYTVAVVLIIKCFFERICSNGN